MALVLPFLFGQGRSSSRRGASQSRGAEKKKTWNTGDTEFLRLDCETAGVHETSARSSCKPGPTTIGSFFGGIAKVYIFNM